MIGSELAWPGAIEFFVLRRFLPSLRRRSDPGRQPTTILAWPLKKLLSPVAIKRTKSVPNGF